MDELLEDLKEVVDARGARYRLGGLRGAGGQGAVREVVSGRLAVKLFADRSPARREQLRRQLLQVKLLPLSSLPVARPLEMLQPPVLGYVMELITGMEPLQRLMAPPAGTYVAEWGTCRAAVCAAGCNCSPGSPSSWPGCMAWGWCTRTPPTQHLRCAS